MVPPHRSRLIFSTRCLSERTVACTLAAGDCPRTLPATSLSRDLGTWVGMLQHVNRQRQGIVDEVRSTCLLACTLHRTDLNAASPLPLARLWIAETHALGGRFASFARLISLLLSCLVGWRPPSDERLL